MKNSSMLKNELIFEYASGTASISKQLMAAAYLHLNSKESSLYSNFENYCGDELKKSKPIELKKLTYNDCLNDQKNYSKTNLNNHKNPIYNFIDFSKKIIWKKVYSGFFEHSFNLSKNENAKLIKMEKGVKVPLHSHNGKEYILVLEGSFCDEYGNYKKGDLQINDSRIKHTPTANKDTGCICLTITEQELVFFGPFAPILNIIEFIKYFFASKTNL